MARRNSYLFPGEDAPREWNMNDAWLMEIMSLWSQAHLYRQRQGDSASLESWWDAMRSIWAMMRFDVEDVILNVEEDDKIKHYKEYVNKVEKNFTVANNLFFAAQRNVGGASAFSVKLLDEIENDIKYIQGALRYFKLRREQEDPRYGD